MTDFSTESPDPVAGGKDEDMTDLARFLREGAGQEWRAEREATEFEVHQGRLRRRPMREVAQMLLHRGDRVTIEAIGSRFSGKVVGCGDDYVTVETDLVRVDARTDRIAMVVQRRSSGGAAAKGVAPTWRARLLELELGQAPVEVFTPLLGVSRKGRIRAVSSDHIWLAGANGEDCYLPIDQLTAITSRRPAL